MKNLHIKMFTLMSLVMLIGFSSCKDYLDVNIDPNVSTVTTIPLQLSAAQMQTAIGLGNRIMPTCAIWSQHYTGGPGVSLGDPAQHILAPSEMNGMWASFYRSNSNLQYIIEEGADEPNYRAIAMIWQSYNYATLVDMVGDIPYTEALKGDIKDGSVLHPKYDNAKDVVYPGVIQKLTDAIALIDGARSHPGSDDLIYGGDMDKWEKFANSLLLRCYMRTGAYGLADSIDAADVITTNADGCMMQFYDVANERNPFWNAAKSTSLGNFYVGTTVALDHLQATTDPRLNLFFDVSNSGQHVGMKPGDVEAWPTSASFSTPNGAKKAAGGKIFNPAAPVIFFSAWEGNLLLAERATRNGGDGKAAYEAGIKANFAYLGATGDSAYIANNGLGADAASAIKAIALQKWTCMNGLQPVECWIETRRFDTPNQAIFSSNGGIFRSPSKNAIQGSGYPSIMPYPDIEESLNLNFPGPHPITAKVFWDN